MNSAWLAFTCKSRKKNPLKCSNQKQKSFGQSENDHYVDINFVFVGQALFPFLPIDFVYNFFSSIACNQSCKSCGPNSSRCLTCIGKTVLHDGECTSECPSGYYADATGRCRGKAWIVIIKNYLICLELEQNIVGKTLALHPADLGLIFSILHGPLNATWSGSWMQR